MSYIHLTVKNEGGVVGVQFPAGVLIKGPNVEVEYIVKKVASLDDDAVRAAAESLVKDFPNLFCTTEESSNGDGTYNVVHNENIALAERAAAIAVAAYRHHTSNNMNRGGIVPR